MDIESKMMHLLVDRFQIDNNLIESGAEFKKDLGLDSLDLMELVIELENAFNIQISDEDAASILTFADAVNCVKGGMHRQKG
ncbi:acyl carrier protein [Pedobacter sp.]|uniref:acyl carrier protein n=1 Tax=Pedobacter sp. TaxID=1411316 RepID=UPI003C393BE1